MGTFLCPRCSITKNQVPRVGMDSDLNIRHHVRDYANDAAARVEHARNIIFNSGLSVGGDLEILKRGSLIPTRVMRIIFSFPMFPAHDQQNAYHTELNVNPAKIMPVDILHDCELGFGKGVITHNIRIFHTLGQGAINTFDARWAPQLYLTILGD
jgi:hypothetical protein